MKKLFATIFGILFTFSAVACGEPSCAHDYVWRDYGAVHKSKCIKCGEIEAGSESPHEAIDVAVKAPTDTEEGHEMGKICSICRRILEGCKILPARTPFKKKTFGDLNYCEYLPELRSGQKAPLVLFMHGAGERGSDNQAQLRNAIKQVVHYESDSPFMKAVVLAPQCPSGEFWTNADHANGTYLLAETAETEVLKNVKALVDEYLSYDYIDADRVYVMGLSMGGFATFELLTRYPDVFAAAVPICGGGPTDGVEAMKNIPIYAFHGAKDPIVPYAGTKTMVELIQEAGGENVLFKTFEKGYHDIWNKAITYEGDEQIPALAEWLFSQKK